LDAAAMSVHLSAKLALRQSKKGILLHVFLISFYQILFKSYQIADKAAPAPDFLG